MTNQINLLWNGSQTESLKTGHPLSPKQIVFATCRHYYTTTVIFIVIF